MTINGFRLGAPDIAYIGAGVTVKGAIVVPDAIIVDGVVEGDVTAPLSGSDRLAPSRAMSSRPTSTSRARLPTRRTSRSSCSSARAAGWKAMSIVATCRLSGALCSPAASSRSIAPRRT